MMPDVHFKINDMRVCIRLFFFFSVVLSPGLLIGQVYPGSILRIDHTQDFGLNGQGSASEWQKAEWIALPHREGVKTYMTQVKLLYSVTGVYCLFSCEDEKINSTLKNDFADLWKEDVVEAFFWPDESIPLYFEYELSPTNFELPILVPNFNGVFFGWRPWHFEGDRKTRHATRIASNSWTAEFFIPYTLLKPLTNIPPQKGTKWRCNFYRIDHDNGVSEWSWQPTRTNFHDIATFGTLLFD